MANGIELAKAYVQVIPSTEGISEKLKGEFGSAGSEAGEAGGSEAGRSFGDAIKGALKTVGALATTAVAGATTAIVGMTKSAVEEFANYEQLAGGVETLFGEEFSSVVMNNARNAFETAGLSANEYMETVTSFSASLIQSVGGDTKKAATIADQALVAMSDNANKMGTSMESIQNAYQGFAKQNYTMLDNLKLGYGGTQAEMIRLINESGVLNETIDSMDGIGFDTIITAIGKVQDKLGITGTTKAEASGTIQGSIAQMSAAWKNLLTGMADPSQDFYGLINNLIDSVMTVAGQLIPKIAETLPQVVRGINMLINLLIPEMAGIIEQLLPSLIEGAISLAKGIVLAFPQIRNILTEQLPVIINGILEIIPQIVTVIEEMLPIIGQAGIEIAMTLIDYAVENMPTFIPELAQLIVDIAMKLTDSDSIGQILDTALIILQALTDGLLAGIPVLVEALPEIVVRACNTFIEQLPQFIEVAGEMIYSLAYGLINSLPSLIKRIPEMVGKILLAFGTGFEAILDIGGNLVAGLWRGIKDNFEWFKNQIKEWVGNVMSFIKNLFGIRSPSKEFAKIGAFLDMGLAEGISDNMRPIEDAMSDIARVTTGTLNSQISVSGSLRSPGAASTGSMAALIGTVETLGRKMERMQVVLDSGVMIGTVDMGVGRNTSIAARGVALA